MKKILTSFRNTLEVLAKELSIGFHNFPSGSCGDTSEVLAEFLKDQGYGDFEYVCGVRGDNVSHAWLEQNELIIDITGDQFSDNKDNPVYIGLKNSWYDSFDIIIRHSAGYNNLSEPHKSMLMEVHNKIKQKINF